MVFITGDTHGNFNRIKSFCQRFNTSKKDVIIILGDSGLNYYTDKRSIKYKAEAESLPITLFCIHGNHEERANNINTYTKRQLWNGKVLVEDRFPSLKFAMDGEIYSIPTSSGKKKAIVIGGAYSVDKQYRLLNGLNWYESEQLNLEERHKIDNVVSGNLYNIDLVLTHTCPLRYIPTEWFISGIDQCTVDRSMEEWLDSLYEKGLCNKTWYCGHYHGDKTIDNMIFMFNSVLEL